MTTNFAPQSRLPLGAPPAHVAIVPDGNGRWATARGLPRSDGHRAGVDTVRRIVGAAPALGISTLTLHAFSTDNWKRPAAEVRGVLACIAEFLDAERATCVAEGIRVTVIGRRDRLPDTLLRAIDASEQTTASGRRLHLRLAVDYSSREAIREGVTRAWGLGRDAVERILGGDGPPGEPVPDVDLLVRTGGEFRLSDFLLWECAYAELVFRGTLWPDFSADDLADAVLEYRSRDRRFGGLSSEGRGDGAAATVAAQPCAAGQPASSTA